MPDIVKERPVLFNAPMVRAILDGSKTQTRRIVKTAKDHFLRCELAPCELAGEVNSGNYHNCSYGRPGERLWVRESWQAWHQTSIEYNEWEVCDGPPSQILDQYGRASVEYHATSQSSGPWRPSIHMPRWAGRIDLLIRSVRIERLQDISEADALAEGITYDQLPDNPHDLQRARTWYRGLWEEINGAGSWEANPWVWVIGFERVKP